MPIQFSPNKQTPKYQIKREIIKIISPPVEIVAAVEIDNELNSYRIVDPGTLRQLELYL